MNHEPDSDATTSEKAATDNTAAKESDFWGGPDVVICSYSRAQAIADGVLIDASKLASEAGFRYPVALTSAAWRTCVEVPPADKTHDQVGRLWDVLNVLRFAIKCGAPGADTIYFCVDVADENEVITTVRLKSICGPGDDAAPVVTITLPDED